MVIPITSSLEPNDEAYIEDPRWHPTSFNGGSGPSARFSNHSVIPSFVGELSYISIAGYTRGGGRLNCRLSK